MAAHARIHHSTLGHDPHSHKIYIPTTTEAARSPKQQLRFPHLASSRYFPTFFVTAILFILCCISSGSNNSTSAGNQGVGDDAYVAPSISSAFITTAHAAAVYQKKRISVKASVKSNGKVEVIGGSAKIIGNVGPLIGAVVAAQRDRDKAGPGLKPQYLLAEIRSDGNSPMARDEFGEAAAGGGLERHDGGAASGGSNNNAAKPANNDVNNAAAAKLPPPAPPAPPAAEADKQQQQGNDLDKDAQSPAAIGGSSLSAGAMPVVVEYDPIPPHVRPYDPKDFPSLPCQLTDMAAAVTMVPRRNPFSGVVMGAKIGPFASTARKLTALAIADDDPEHHTSNHHQQPNGGGEQQQPPKQQMVPPQPPAKEEAAVAANVPLEQPAVEHAATLSTPITVSTDAPVAPTEAPTLGVAAMAAEVVPNPPAPIVEGDIVGGNPLPEPPANVIPTHRVPQDTVDEAGEAVPPTQEAAAVEGGVPLPPPPEKEKLAQPVQVVPDVPQPLPAAAGADGKRQEDAPQKQQQAGGAGIFAKALDLLGLDGGAAEGAAADGQADEDGGGGVIEGAGGVLNAIVGGGLAAVLDNDDGNERVDVDFGSIVMGRGSRRKGGKHGGKDGSSSGSPSSPHFDTVPYNEDELADGRHPILWSGGTLTHAVRLNNNNQISSNTCKFNPVEAYQNHYDAYFSNPANQAASLQNRHVVFIGDSIIRNQMMAAIAITCNPYLLFNCSHRYYHLFNLVDDYPHSADFLNGPLQCYLNGTELKSHNPNDGMVATRKIPRDAEDPPLPFTFEPATTPYANQCGNRLKINNYAIGGVTHFKSVFTKAEKRREWHRAYPPPFTSVRFTETNTTFTLISAACHRKSHIGRILSNLAMAKRAWPAAWGGSIDMVVANGGLHCERKALGMFYQQIGTGIERLRLATRGYDGRPMEFIYFEKPFTALSRPQGHRQVDESFLMTYTWVIESVVRNTHGHTYPSYYYTKDRPRCAYNDHLHPAPICASTLSSLMLEGIRYIFAHQSIVPNADVAAQTSGGGGGGGGAIGAARRANGASANDVDEDDKPMPRLRFRLEGRRDGQLSRATAEGDTCQSRHGEAFCNLPWLVMGSLILVGIVLSTRAAKQQRR